MPISLVAAVAKNGCIGKNGGIPWKIPGEQLVLKELTIGKVVIMGRKTWESIPEKYRPLAERTNVVVTRQPNHPLPPGVEAYSTIQAAIQAHTAEQICIIGGAELYKTTIDLADTLFITHINEEVEGDTFFPTIDPAIWEEAEHQTYPQFHLITYRRRAI